MFQTTMTPTSLAMMLAVPQKTVIASISEAIQKKSYKKPDLI